MRRSSYQSSGSHQGRSRTNSGISISEACQGLQLSDPSTSLPVSSVPAEPQGESTVEAFGYPPTASSSYLSADFGIDPYAPIPSGSPYLSSHTYTQDTTEEQGWSTFDAPSSSAASKIPIVRLDPDNLAYQSSFGDIEAPRQDSGVGEMRYFGLPGSHYDFNFRYQHPSAMASYDEANHYGGMGMSYASYGSTQAPASQYSRTSLTLADPAATSIYARGISASPTFVSLSPAEREVKRQRRQHSKSGSQRDKGSGSSYHASGESLGMGISDYPAVSVVPSSTIVTSSEGTTYLPQYTGSITSSPYAAEYSSSPGQYGTSLSYGTSGAETQQAYLSTSRSRSASGASDGSGSGMYSTTGGASSRSPNAQAQVRVLTSRPKPQCFEHGCNGRKFSTFSNLLRHQRERSGTATKSYCPNCGAEFTRTTARNGHMAHEKCRSRRGSDN